MEDTINGDYNEAWQKARELLREVYAVSNDGMFAVDFSSCERLHWSTMAIMLNIADGMHCASPEERLKFLDLAERAAGELCTLLTLARDRSYLTGEQWTALTGRTHEIVAMIVSARTREEGGTAAPPANALPEEAAECTGRGGETVVIRPGLNGWSRGYSAATGMWGWKLRVYSQ